MDSMVEPSTTGLLLLGFGTVFMLISMMLPLFLMSFAIMALAIGAGMLFGLHRYLRNETRYLVFALLLAFDVAFLVPFYYGVVVLTGDDAAFWAIIRIPVYVISGIIVFVTWRQFAKCKRHDELSS